MRHWCGFARISEGLSNSKTCRTRCNLTKLVAPPLLPNYRLQLHSENYLSRLLAMYGQFSDVERFVIKPVMAFN